MYWYEKDGSNKFFLKLAEHVYFELQGGQRRISSIQDHERNYNRVFGAFHRLSRGVILSALFTYNNNGFFGKIK